MYVRPWWQPEYVSEDWPEPTGRTANGLDVNVNHNPQQIAINPRDSSSAPWRENIGVLLLYKERDREEAGQPWTPARWCCCCSTNQKQQWRAYRADHGSQDDLVSIEAFGSIFHSHLVSIRGFRLHLHHTLRRVARHHSSKSASHCCVPRYYCTRHTAYATHAAYLTAVLCAHQTIRPASSHGTPLPH